KRTALLSRDALLLRQGCPDSECRQVGFLTRLRLIIRQKEAFMRDRLLSLRIVSALAMVAFTVGLAVSITMGSVQTPGSSAPAPKTPWGWPDPKEIWTAKSDTPLHRPARYANQIFFTDAQRAELDRTRPEIPSRDRRAE